MNVRGKAMENEPRWFVTKRGAHPYSGPAWRAINEEPRWFVEKGDSEKMAKRLTQHNPVGFSVRTIPLGFRAGEYPRIIRERWIGDAGSEL